MAIPKSLLKRATNVIKLHEQKSQQNNYQVVWKSDYMEKPKPHELIVILTPYEDISDTSEGEPSNPM